MLIIQLCFQTLVDILAAELIGFVAWFLYWYHRMAYYLIVRWIIRIPYSKRHIIEVRKVPPEICKHFKEFLTNIFRAYREYFWGRVSCAAAKCMAHCYPVVVSASSMKTNQVFNGYGNFFFGSCYICFANPKSDILISLFGNRRIFSHFKSLWQMYFSCR